MSVRGTLVLVAAFLLVPVAVGAQSLGELAKKERQRREALKKPQSKVLTEADLEKAKGSTLSSQAGDPSNAKAPTGDAAEGEKKAEGAAGEAKGGKSEEEVQAEQSAAWKKKIEAAEAKLKTLQDAQAKLQAELNDPNLGYYTQSRETLTGLLADAAKDIAAAQAEVDSLGAEGRAKAYRR